jgi:predicted amidohydrolase
MRDFIPVAFFVQFVLSIFIYFGSKGQHEVDADGVDIFRIKPSVAWIVTIASFGISAILGFAIFTSKPTPTDAPLSIMIGELLFFFFGLYGVYCIRMRIRVDAQSIRVKKLFRTHETYFHEIRSLDDRQTGRYRTFDIVNDQGRRILRVTSTFLPDYENLVQLVEEGVRTHRRRKA